MRLGNFVNDLVQEIILFTSPVTKINLQTSAIKTQNKTLFHGVLSKHYSIQQIEELFVEGRQGTSVFVDTSVYSKNRQFRLIMSSKILKKTAFTFAEKSILSQPLTLERFKSTLVSLVKHDYNLTILTSGERIDSLPRKIRGRILV